MIKKRSISIAGHPTSVSIEDDFWMSLQEIAKKRNMTMPQLITNIDEAREGNLSSTLRLYVLNYYKQGENLS